MGIIMNIRYILLKHTNEIEIKTAKLTNNLFDELSSQVGEKGEVKPANNIEGVYIMYDDFLGSDFSEEDFLRAYNPNASLFSNTDEYGDCILCKIEPFDYKNDEDWEGNHIVNITDDEITKITDIIKAEGF